MKKKIVFLITSLNSGGAERVLVNLLNAFCLNYEVHLILLYNEETFYEIDKNVKIHYLSNQYSASEGLFQSIKQNVFFLKKIIEIFRLYKYDLVISFTTTLNVLSIFASKYISIPCIISERNNPKVYVPNIFWRFLRDTSYFFTDGLVVQTDFIKYFYKKKIKENKIIVIPNPVNEKLISLRKDYHNRENIILTVGRLDSNKNQKMLIEAFANLNVDDWRLIIVGDGILKDEYAELAISLGIDHKVDFVGNVQNVWDYYNQAKIFAFTSNSEGFPNALLEAMSFGLACVSTDCPSGPSEIILNNENGYLIEMGNIKQLEDRLSILIHNPDICDQFSKNAMASTEKFSIAEVKKLWEVQIQKIL